MIALIGVANADQMFSKIETGSKIIEGSAEEIDDSTQK